MRGRETRGSSDVRHVFKTGNKWDGMRGNMLEKSRWGDRGDWVSACGPCLSQIRRADKTGRRKGL